MGRIVTATPEHEVVYQDIAALIAKNKGSVSAEELLAIAANMLGKLIAMQDQRTMSQERAMEIVVQNLEAGNEQAVAILNSTKGST